MKKVILTVLVCLLFTPQAFAIDPGILGAYGIIHGIEALLGSSKKTPTPPPALAGKQGGEGSLTGGFFELGFSPKGQGIILSAIRNAKRSILVATYDLTSREIRDSLIKALGRGIKVLIVADPRARGIGTLAKSGIPVRINDRYPLMHNSFLVIDGKSVVLGSLSRFDQNRNSGNSLYLKDVRELAHFYALEWKNLWMEGKK